VKVVTALEEQENGSVVVLELTQDVVKVDQEVQVVETNIIM
tara:strand:- start:34 stop:156 length:123 start_codon:yes stop_codon:yes gene_type:complete